jgi:hypothetical protein
LPAATAFDVVTVSVAVLGPELKSRDIVLSFGVRFGSTLTRTSETIPVKPFSGVNVRFEVPVADAPRLSGLGVASGRKSGVAEQVVGEAARTGLGRYTATPRMNTIKRILVMAEILNEAKAVPDKLLRLEDDNVPWRSISAGI